ncbi:MAG: hypothetical protein ABIW84_00970, partial [Ilumatobacteraceae bacterium]
MAVTFRLRNARPGVPANGVTAGLLVALALAISGIAVHEWLDAVSPHVVVVVLAAVAANTGIVRPVHRPGLALAGRRLL